MTDHVKIYGIKPRIQYVADGTLTVYEFPFAIFSTSDIDVYFGDTLQDTSIYTVSEARHSDGGSVTFGSAPTSGTIITIVRNLSIERTSDFQEGSTLRAKVLNDELDYQIACQQQIAENLNRAMTLPPYAENDEVDLTLPAPSAGKAIVWNSSGTTLENSTVSVNALESTLNGYKTAAQTAAGIATTQAGIASDKASIATNQAQTAAAQAEIAVTKATEAASSVNQLNGMRTNCVTQIPQDIKLELSAGVLTLKAGSKVYVPNGIGVFDTVTVANDTTINCSTATGQTMVFYRTDGFSFGDVAVSDCSSGTTPAYGFFYDTSTNKIDFYDGSAFQGNTFSFPLAIITVSSGTVTSIDQVFNGFGFIGNTIFGLPGVKGLWPDGRNTDGTLKNIVKTIDSVTTHTWSPGLWGNNFPVVLGQWGVDFLINTATFIGGKRPENPVTYTRWYNNEENYWEDYVSSWNKTYFYIWGYVDLSNGQVTSFKVKPVFYAADFFDAVKYSDKKQVVSWGMPNYTAAVSKTKETSYTAESNGFLIGYDYYVGSGDASAYVYIDGVNVRIYSSQDSGATNTWCYPIAKGSSYSYSGDANMSMYFVPAIGG